MTLQMPQPKMHYWGLDARQATMAFRFECSECDAVTWVPKHKNYMQRNGRASSDNLVEAGMAGRKLEEDGWQVGKRRLLCPRHKEEPKMMNGTTKQDHFAEFKPVAGPSATPAAAALASTAIPPAREATRAENQRIQTELDERYLTAKGMYRADGSDESVARTLNLPRAFVTRLREMLYGAGAGNEAGNATLTEVADLRKAFDLFETHTMRSLDQMKAKIEAVARKVGA